MTSGPNEPWFSCLPGCETSVPCGAGRHTVRWEAGSLVLPSHPDPEAELVLAALGAETAVCIELAEVWARHADDLSVLAIWPRGPDDEVTVSWDDMAAATQAGSWPGPAPPPGPSGQPRLGRPGGSGRARPAMARGAGQARSQQREMLQKQMLAAQRRRDDLLKLLALGYGFQVRLIGQVAAAHAAAGTGGPGQAGQGKTGRRHGIGPRLQDRPALVAAIAGRLAPVAEKWLGIDPGQVVVSLHHGPGWGSAELTGRESGRQLRISLPAGWLASVWACGFALTGRHLIVAVPEPGWPRAQVLGLRAPGAEPELIEVAADPGGPGDVPHWTI
jgi:hypothetical protein